MVVALAEKQGESFELTSLSRKTRISSVTIKKLLFALEAIFLIKLIPSEGGISSRMVFFEDQGIVTYLTRKREIIGFLDAHQMLRLIYSCIGPQFRYRRELVPDFFQYQTRGGAFVPFGVHTRFGTLGLIPNPDNEALPGSLSSARSFLKYYKNSKVLILTLSKTPRVFDQRCAAVPLSWLI